MAKGVDKQIYLTFHQNDVLKNISFSLFIDRSNFKCLKKNPDGFDVNRSDLFKSEIADNVAIEGVYISAKCYSVKTIDRASVKVCLRRDPAAPPPPPLRFIDKKALKGCIAKIAATEFVHSHFVKVIEEAIVRNAKTVSTNHIRFNKELGCMTTATLS